METSSCQQQPQQDAIGPFIDIHKENTDMAEWLAFLISKKLGLANEEISSDSDVFELASLINANQALSNEKELTITGKNLYFVLFFLNSILKSQFFQK